MRVRKRLKQTPLLQVQNISKFYGDLAACLNISLDLYPGEILAIVGESGSGKSTLLNCISGKTGINAGEVRYRSRNNGTIDVHGAKEPVRRHLARTEWGYVHQNPRDGLRGNVSAGANIGERLMGTGSRHYGEIRSQAEQWLERVEIDPCRIDHQPRTFSGGMQQRLQIARNLVSGPSLIFMDEPTGGLDVSVQAKLLDLLRNITADLGLAVVLVTHDLGVARLLAHRIMVMKRGQVVETGLTDQVLDDPHHPYTQLLVSSILV
ncbi:putative phosphonate transport system ATP-binding protein [Desulfocicer vacuolatum DSM 3385]|uniref:Putative phosphonate transport system ATP-binding protein n=1 Tax=Desulfocicer vacuolatum DSM 3385 TaxID=1121400 RepID=A0A1W2ER53_9BACT|nr:phosphonate C-P lyase system protein PhnK [Desulfocicer vacuolatum]SMD12184.1 putative phosphonate transport system ATP-binding protein [Desulfocicer vacuolatum DSM 3385]